MAGDSASCVSCNQKLSLRTHDPFNEDDRPEPLEGELGSQIQFYDPQGLLWPFGKKCFLFGAIQIFGPPLDMKQVNGGAPTSGWT